MSVPLLPVGSSQRKNRLHDSAADVSHPDPSVVSYACSAVKGFYKSIALSVESSLQDTLRWVWKGGEGW